MAELADASDSKSDIERCVGSTPTPGTKQKKAGEDNFSMEQDVRWRQRHDSFHQACGRVLEITESGRTPEQLSELEQEGLIQRFEYTYELAWKALQDLLRFRGYEDFVPGPNGVLRKAFEVGLISDHDAWRRMAKARTTTAHTYNEGEALAVVNKIFEEYSLLFRRLDERLRIEAARGV